MERRCKVWGGKRGTPLISSLFLPSPSLCFTYEKKRTRNPRLPAYPNGSRPAFHTFSSSVSGFVASNQNMSVCGVARNAIGQVSDMRCIDGRSLRLPQATQASPNPKGRPPVSEASQLVVSARLRVPFHVG